MANKYKYKKNIIDPKRTNHFLRPRETPEDLESKI